MNWEFGSLKTIGMSSLTKRELSLKRWLMVYIKEPENYYLYLERATDQLMMFHSWFKCFNCCQLQLNRKQLFQNRCEYFSMAVFIKYLFCISIIFTMLTVWQLFRDGEKKVHLCMSTCVTMVATKRMDKFYWNFTHRFVGAISRSTSLKAEIALTVSKLI